MGRVLKVCLWLVTAILVLICIYVIYILMSPSATVKDPIPPIAGAPSSMKSVVEKGEYLARAADCVACHTSHGGIPYAGGLPFKLPFGTLYATNITPDKKNGIGNWSDEQFIRAVREGVGPNGNLYPAMPYTSYRGLSRDDVLAIKAYLFSLPPVEQPNIKNELPFPFNQRWGITLWNMVFFKNISFVADSEQDEQWNRGAYLATALGHCSECHTPRNLAFATMDSKNLSGGVIQGWYAGNITPDNQTGIGAWTDNQISQYIATGHAQGRSSASGPMAEAVENSLQFLTTEDNQALVKYLRNIKPITTDTTMSVNLEPKGALSSTAIGPYATESSLGKRLFAADCSGCHQWNGSGRQSKYASLVGSTAVNDPQGRSVVQAIISGTSINIGGQHEVMPSFGSTYSDEEIAAVANFVVHHFGGKEGKVSVKQVSKQREQ